MNHIKNKSLWVFLFLSISLSAQEPLPYQPLKDAEDLRDATVVEMEQRYQKDVQNIEGPHRKEIKEQYTQRFEGLAEKVKNGHFITNPDLNLYFDEILSHILSVNPTLKNREIRLLISRYFWPNASCHGEGTIVLNLGLISRLENESQLAFVICHELSHDYLNHVNQAIRQHVNQLNSKSTQKKLKKLSKQKYNTYDEATALMRNLVFDMRRHSRFRESEADSLALVWMQPTRYDTKAAIRCLEILDEVDTPKRTQMIDFRKHFETAEFKIRDRWLVVDEGNGFVYDEGDKALQDSIKTHPDCQQRIKAVEQFAHREAAVQSTTDFQDYIRLADYEIIEGEYSFGNYGRALFHALLLVDEYPKDAYLHSVIMDCLFQLYHHQKAHELGKVLQLPESHHTDNYKHFLSFIHNLRLRDLGKLGYYYGLKNGTGFEQEESFRVAHLFCASLTQKAADWRALKQQYFTDFPKGDYKEIVKTFKPDFDNKK